MKNEVCHILPMTVILTIMDSAVKLEKRRVLVVSTAVRKDLHITICLPCPTVNFSSTKLLHSLSIHCTVKSELWGKKCHTLSPA